jgi:uncharacterized protein involved in exopolysaccharide biosynthesis
MSLPDAPPPRAVPPSAESLVPRAPAVTVHAYETRDDLSVVGVLGVLLRYRYLILAGVTIGALLGVTIARLARATYTSGASFMPHGRKAPTSLSGLAAQFGLAVPINDGAQSPQFYADLIRSRFVLGQLTDTTYAIDGGAPRALTDVLDARGRSPAERRDDALRRLRGMMQTNLVAKTGVVSFTVRSRDAGLSRAIADRTLRVLDRFNLEMNQGQAAAERQFTERRVAEVAADLQEAENRLQFFLQRNRNYENSPQLAFEHQRLARAVTMRQEIYTSLSQAYEQAKIEEVRDTPVLALIDRPELPAHRDARGTVAKLLAGSVVGGLIAMILAFLANSLRLARSDRLPELDELSGLAASAWRDLRRPWQALGRTNGREH